MKSVLRWVLYAGLAVAITVLVVLVLIFKIALAPGQGEWATELRLGPLKTQVGVPTALRLLTSPWVAPRLHGRQLDTRFGPVQVDWSESARRLRLDCVPCRAVVPALGSQPLALAQLRLTVRRDADRLQGTIDLMPSADALGVTAAGATGAPKASETSQALVAGSDADRPGAALQSLSGQWSGQISQRDVRLQLDIADAPVARWYRVLVPDLPELQRAQLSGTLGLRAQFALPEGIWGLQPRVVQLSVSGLGTEALLNARTNCGPAVSLGKNSWLARAVIAAEDQRFFQHPGYDVIELSAALDSNQKKGGIDRGGSTLTQQLAKMLVTGSERSLSRKMREILYAIEMEQTLGKARILHLYLNNAPWGKVCGAEAAARHYFKRGAAQLEPAQAVWLATMLHAPSIAVERWNREGELDPARVKWVAEGIRGISRAQREALLKSVETARYAPPG